MVNTNLSKSKNVDNKNETEGKSVRLHIRMMETSTVIFSLFRHTYFFFLLTFCTPFRVMTEVSTERLFLSYPFLHPTSVLLSDRTGQVLCFRPVLQNRTVQDARRPPRHFLCSPLGYESVLR